MINEVILFILLTVNSGDTTDIDSVFADTTADSTLANTTIFIDKKDLEWMPLSEILAQQIGIVKTSTGLHFRGGDIGEEVFFIDGVEVTDPVYRVPCIAFNRDAISEMSITLDGFDAGYGNSSSGRVNILTKEGTEHYDGDIRYFTNTDIGEHRCNLNIGGPVPLLKNITFFASGNMDTTGNHSPSILPKSSNALYQGNGMAKINWKPISSLKIGLKGELLHQKYKIYDHRRSRGSWIEDWPLYKFDYSAMNLSLTHNINHNTSYTINLGKMSSRFKASSQGGKSYNEWKAIGTRLPWVNVAEDSLWYNPETKKWKEGWSEERAWMWYYENINKLGYWNPSAGKWEWNFDAEPKDIIDALEFRCYQTGTYLMSSTSREGDELIYTRGDSIYIYYHKFNLDKYIRDLERYVAGEIPGGSIEPSGNLDHMQYNKYNEDEWGRFEYNFYPFWEEREHSKNFISFSFSSKMGEYNKVKLGGSLKKYELNSTAIDFTYHNPRLDGYEGEPRVYAVYLSDKIKYEELNINAGIRLDCFNPSSECFIHLDSLDAGKKSAETKYGVSPRVNVAFQIFDKSVIYVNYGHFYKPQNFAYLYQNPNPDLFAGFPSLGNPNLPMQKTVMYAGGIKQKLPLDFVLGASIYCKDTKNLLTTRTMTTVWHHKLVSYTIVEAENEARAYGVDLALNKKMSNYLSGAIGYSYLNSKCKAPPETFYFYYSSANEYSLEIDKVHSWKTNIHFSLPSVTAFNPISNLNFDLRYTYTTGALFDSTDQKGTFVGKSRMPPTSRIDMRIEKGFKITGVKLGLFMNAWNVFNYQNVLKVYSSTGNPDNNGTPPEWDETSYTAVYNNREEYYKERYGWDSPQEMYQANVDNWGKYYNNPGHYDIPRIIQFGLVTHF